MDLLKAMQLSAAGLKVEEKRMRVVAENLANADNMASEPGGDPYRRQIITFKNVLDRSLGIKKVEVDKILTDNSKFEERYDPGNPAADAKGYVRMPNVKSMVELMDMKQAQRTYEANLNVIQAAKSMLQKTIDLLRA